MRRLREMKRFVFILILALSFVAFIKSRNSTETFEIILSESGFEPSELEIPKGSKVIFLNKSGAPFWPASDPHPLHDIYPTFDAEKPININESWSFMANKIGNWSYHDHLFFTRRGLIKVVAKKEWEEGQKFPKRNEIIQDIENKGNEKAYLSLKKKYPSDNVNSHAAFHIFGEVLYEKAGIAGISSCDDYAGFGCYHGLFTKAVSEKGIEVALDFDKECVKNFGSGAVGCFHGIGHGLVEFLGYQKIEDALVICAKLTWQGVYSGCQSGVFMEYNFRNSVNNGESVVTVREIEKNLYEPCQSINQRFKQACYFEQASWWRQILATDFVKMGGLCDDLYKENKEACLLGLGYSIADRSGFSKGSVIEACNLMPNSYSESICRAGGSWAFFANPDRGVKPDELCQGLGDYESLCLEKRIILN